MSEQEFGVDELRLFLELWDVTRISIHYRSGGGGPEMYIDIDPDVVRLLLSDDPRYHADQQSAENLGTGSRDSA